MINELKKGLQFRVNCDLTYYPSLRRHYPHQVQKGMISATNRQHPLISHFGKSVAKLKSFFCSAKYIWD